MHETKSVHTESSELCHQVSTQKVLDFGASWILDFWMRMLKPTIQWSYGASELYREHSMGTYSYPDRFYYEEKNIVKCNTLR